MVKMEKPYFFAENEIKHQGRKEVLDIAEFLSDLKKVYEKHGVKKVKGSTGFIEKKFGISNATLEI